MNWLDSFNLPKACLVQKRIPLKKLGEHSTLRQKQLIEKNISSLMLVALVDEETSRIRSFQDTVEIYQVFFMLEIVSKVFPLSQEVYQLLHSLFPNPTILFCEKDDKLQLSSALKRINLNDSELTTVDETIISPVLSKSNDLIKYFQQLDYQRIRVAHLKEYYMKISDAIQLSTIINDLNLYPSIHIDIQMLLSWTKEIKQLQTAINQNEELYRKENSLSRRMDLHMQIKKDKQCLENLQKKTMEAICQN
jgi:hypothetical protein